MHRQPSRPKWASLLTGVAATAFATTSVMAAGDDIFFASDGTKIVIGELEKGATAPALSNGDGDALQAGDIDKVEIGTRIFVGEFDAFGAIDDPGFIAVSQAVHDDLSTGFSALAGNTAVDLTVEPVTIGASTRNLWFWQPASVGDTMVDFGASNVALTVEFGPSTIATADGGSGSDTGTLVTTDADGAIHRHLEFVLGGGFDEGIYLLSLSASMNGLDPSDPFYIVFATETFHDTAALAAAESFIATSFIPEPGTAGLLLASGAMLAWRRRRTI